jgi:hypothetical protein
LARIRRFFRPTLRRPVLLRRPAIPFLPNCWIPKKRDGTGFVENRRPIDKIPFSDFSFIFGRCPLIAPLAFQPTSFDELSLRFL